MFSFSFFGAPKLIQSIKNLPSILAELDQYTKEFINLFKPNQDGIYCEVLLLDYRKVLRKIDTSATSVIGKMQYCFQYDPAEVAGYSHEDKKTISAKCSQAFEALEKSYAECRKAEAVFFAQERDFLPPKNRTSSVVKQLNRNSAKLYEAIRQDVTFFFIEEKELKTGLETVVVKQSEIDQSAKFKEYFIKNQLAPLREACGAITALQWEEQPEQPSITAKPTKENKRPPMQDFISSFSSSQQNHADNTSSDSIHEADLDDAMGWQPKTSGPMSQKMK